MYTKLLEIFKSPEIIFKTNKQCNLITINYKNGRKVVIWLGNNIICLDYNSFKVSSNVFDIFEDLKIYSTPDILNITLDKR